MLPKILDIFAPREAAQLPEAEAPPAAPDTSVEESNVRLAAIRETIDPNGFVWVVVNLGPSLRAAAGRHSVVPVVAHRGIPGPPLAGEQVSTW